METAMTEQKKGGERADDKDGADEGSDTPSGLSPTLTGRNSRQSTGNTPRGFEADVVEADKAKNRSLTKTLSRTAGYGKTEVVWTTQNGSEAPQRVRKQAATGQGE
jgi:hypothetical protein